MADSGSGSRENYIENYFHYQKEALRWVSRMLTMNTQSRSQESHLHLAQEKNRVGGENVGFKFPASFCFVVGNSDLLKDIAYDNYKKSTWKTS